MTKLSIIIPVFNAEKYLHQCIGSITRYTGENIEIICINDGSTDNSLEIINSLAQEDGRIAVISQDNQGPATARNAGLKKASGDYVWLIDSDDWIEDESLTEIFEAINLHNPDVIGFASNYYSQKKQKYVSKPEYNDPEIIPEDNYNRNLSLSEARSFVFDLPLEAWSRVYRKHFIQKNKIFFNPNFKLLDDSLFVTEAFLKASTILYLNKKLYNYRGCNKTSLVASHKYSCEKYFRLPVLMAQSCDKLLSDLKFNPNEYKNIILRNLDRALSVLLRMDIYYGYKYYNLLQDYLISSKSLDYSFVQQNKIYKTLVPISKKSYFYFYLKSLFLNVTYFSDRSRISIFGIRIYKRKRI